LTNFNDDKVDANEVRAGLACLAEAGLIQRKDRREPETHNVVTGPVISIMKFKTEEEAVNLANDSSYGLNASVWTSNKEKGLQVAGEIVTGGIAINNALTSSANFDLPFGGAKQSGIGRYHGSYGLHAFSNIKAVMYEKGTKDQDIQWYPFRQDKYRRFLTTFKSLFSEKTSQKIKGLPNMIKLLRSQKKF